ncbi:SAF domain-containing protein [Acrocarpospora sp. B8E8]|uniref:SAF domain-containing protein n=1 Tax=Acrocarpospora sp. B8E8 TaxID=3153572 RepID=UPI00325F4210
MATRTSTTTPQTTARNTALPPLPRHRRRGMVAISIALIAVGALGAAYLVTGLDKRSPVIVAARDIPVGQQIAAQDLAETRVAAEPGVAMIPARQLPEVVGQVAAMDLPQGTLLGPASVTGQHSPREGEQVVPVALKPSQLPARGLNPGDHVLVVITPGEQTVPGQQQEPPAGDVAAVVDRMAGPGTEGLAVVDLLVDADAGVQVARYAATGRIALLLTSRES